MFLTLNNVISHEHRTRETQDTGNARRGDTRTRRHQTQHRHRHRARTRRHRNARHEHKTRNANSTRDAPYYVLKLPSLVVYFFTAKLFITTLTKLYFIWLATLQAFYLVNPRLQKLVHLKLNYKEESS